MHVNRLEGNMKCRDTCEKVILIIQEGHDDGLDKGPPPFSFFKNGNAYILRSLFDVDRVRDVVS